MSVERKIRINSLATQPRVLAEEQMFFLIWDYMAQKIDIKKGVYEKLIGKKEQEKIRYDRKVKMQYFTPGNFVLF